MRVRAGRLLTPLPSQGRGWGRVVRTEEEARAEHRGPPCADSRAPEPRPCGLAFCRPDVGMGLSLFGPKGRRGCAQPAASCRLGCGETVRLRAHATGQPAGLNPARRTEASVGPKGRTERSRQSLGEGCPDGDQQRCARVPRSCALTGPGGAGSTVSGAASMRLGLPWFDTRALTPRRAARPQWPWASTDGRIRAASPAVVRAWEWACLSSSQRAEEVARSRRRHAASVVVKPRARAHTLPVDRAPARTRPRSARRVKPGAAYRSECRPAGPYGALKTCRTTE